jgi:hypothetical protein
MIFMDAFLTGIPCCRGLASGKFGSEAVLNLLTNKLGEYPHRLGEALPSPMNQADITMERMLPQIKDAHPG